MSNVLAWVLATMVTMPIIVFYLIYLITVKTTKDKKISLKLAVDLSGIFFIVAVYTIAFEIWSLSLFWLILIIILSVAIIFTFIHWKISEDIHLTKLLKGIWRFNFLLFFITYLLLSVYGLFVRISSFT